MKQAKKSRQNEKTDKFITTERTGQGHGQRAKRNIYKILPDGLLKGMIIRILTGLDKIVEDLSDTLNKGMRNNIAEIKG